MRLAPLLLLVCTVAAEASEQRLTPLVRAVRAARSSVVNIHSEKHSHRTASAVFASSKDRKVSGMGTGIVIDERGYIVTNHHVVLDVDTLEVSLSDGNRYSAEVVAYNRAKDLAVIKIDPTTPLHVMPLGTSSDLMLAETVFAVGNAFGYEHTITSGIISALGRDVEVNETQSYYNLIQTDASINPGNSGGPLLNLDGEVVGINVAIRAGAQRIGFAIPIDDAREVIAGLIRPERISGVTSGLVTRDEKTADTRQLIVSDIAGPAAEADIRIGDQIVRVEQTTIADGVDLARTLIGHRAGDVVRIELLRGSRRVFADLTLQGTGEARLAAKPPTTRTVSMPSLKTTTVERAWQLLGLKLAPLAPADRTHIGPRYRGGLKVASVRSGSPAARKGIQPGDYLVGLHIWETLNDNDMAYILAEEQVRQHNPLTFYIVRQGKTMFGELAL